MSVSKGRELNHIQCCRLWCRGYTVLREYIQSCNPRTGDEQVQPHGTPCTQGEGCSPARSAHLLPFAGNTLRKVSPLPAPLVRPVYRVLEVRDWGCPWSGFTSVLLGLAHVSKKRRVFGSVPACTPQGHGTGRPTGTQGNAQQLEKSFHHLCFLPKGRVELHLADGDTQAFVSNSFHLVRCYAFTG